MIDSNIREFAYSALTLLKKRNDRNGPPITAYIKALEDELERYKTRLATPIVAHLEDFEKLNAATEAAVKAALAAEGKLPPAAPVNSVGVLEALAEAESKAAAEAAAKPWWKFWGGTSGGEAPEAPKGGCSGGDCACKKAADPAAKEETK